MRRSQDCGEEVIICANCEVFGPGWVRILIADMIGKWEGRKWVLISEVEACRGGERGREAEEGEGRELDIATHYASLLYHPSP